METSMSLAVVGMVVTYIVGLILGYIAQIRIHSICIHRFSKWERIEHKHYHLQKSICKKCNYVRTIREYL